MFYLLLQISTPELGSHSNIQDPVATFIWYTPSLYLGEQTPEEQMWLTPPDLGTGAALQGWSCCLCFCVTSNTFVLQIAQSARKGKEKHHQNKVMKRKGYLMALRRRGEMKWCVEREHMNLLNSFWVWTKLFMPVACSIFTHLTLGFLWDLPTMS